MTKSKRTLTRTASIFLSLIFAFSFCLIAFADSEPCAIIDEGLSPMSLYMICEDCGSNAGLYCANSQLIYTDNVTSHSYSGGTCRVLIYQSYSKYYCTNCGWFQWRFADGASGLSKHYCDSYHYDCGRGVENTCDLNYIPIDGSIIHSD